MEPPGVINIIIIIIIIISFATPVLAHTCLNVFKINFYLYVRTGVPSGPYRGEVPHLGTGRPGRGGPDPSPTPIYLLHIP